MTLANLVDSALDKCETFTICGTELLTFGIISVAVFLFRDYPLKQHSVKFL